MAERTCLSKSEDMIRDRIRFLYLLFLCYLEFISQKKKILTKKVFLIV